MPEEAVGSFDDDPRPWRRAAARARQALQAAGVAFVSSQTPDAPPRLAVTVADARRLVAAAAARGPVTAPPADDPLCALPGGEPGTSDPDAEAVAEQLRGLGCAAVAGVAHDEEQPDWMPDLFAASYDPAVLRDRIWVAPVHLEQLARWLTDAA